MIKFHYTLIQLLTYVQFMIFLVYLSSLLTSFLALLFFIIVPFASKIWIHLFWPLYFCFLYFFLMILMLAFLMLLLIWTYPFRLYLVPIYSWSCSWTMKSFDDDGFWILRYVFEEENLQRLTTQAFFSCYQP